MKNFSSLVYDYVSIIPFGKVATFGEIARAIGSLKYIRAVWCSLYKRETNKNIPIHRVVNGGGLLSKKYPGGGVSGQRKMLKNEGVKVKDGKVDLSQYGFYFW